MRTRALKRRPVAAFLSPPFRTFYPGQVIMLPPVSVSASVPRGHHCGVGAAGVGVNIERLLAARDGILAGVGLKCGLQVILEIGVAVLGVREAENGVTQAFAHGVVGEETVLAEHADVDVAILSD